MNKTISTALLLTLYVVEPPTTVAAVRLASGSTLSQAMVAEESDSSEQLDIPAQWNKLPWEAGNHLAEAFYRVSRYAA